MWIIGNLITHKGLGRVENIFYFLPFAQITWHKQDP